MKKWKILLNTKFKIMKVMMAFFTIEGDLLASLNFMLIVNIVVIYYLRI
ncbi:MAG: hypothetical protein KO217_04815 [Methanobacteriaceae archaeon]|nr:hypothetical protein [Methanobacteriaceae archaeon]